jgi:HPt (histidine-containing phosphotransfer) domain-containing protein
MLPETPAFDPQELLEVLGGDETVFRELIQLYLQEAPKLLGAVRNAVAQGNADALRQAAHALKGTLANLAAPDARAAAEALEVMTRTGDLAGAPTALANLERQLERLHAAIRLSEKM